jgi:hypothetical protein
MGSYLKNLGALLAGVLAILGLVHLGLFIDKMVGHHVGQFMVYGIILLGGAGLLTFISRLK